MRTNRRSVLTAVLGVALISSGCGMRLDRSQILAANTVKVAPERAPAPDSAVGAIPAPSEGAEAAAPATGGAPSAMPGAIPAAAVPSAVPGRLGGAPSATPATGAVRTAAASSSGSPPPPAASVGGAGAPAAGATPTAAGPATPGQTGPIIIGSVGNYSGPAGTAATPMPEAVKAWAAAINARGGLLGRSVQLIVVDDGSDPSRHVAALRDLVENRKVVAFVGNFAAITAGAGRQYLEQVGVPVIGTSCALVVESQSPAFFDQCSPVDDIYINVARTAARFGPASHKMAIFYCAEAEVCRYGDTVLAEKGGAKQAGMEVVYRAQVSLVQPDYTAECLNARNAGADVIFPILDPNGNARIGQSCARQGYRPQFVAAHNSPADIRTKTGLENILLAVPTFPFAGLDTPATEEFSRLYTQTSGKQPGPVASMGWVAAKLFELSATRAAAATRSITSQTLVDALHGMTGETLGGLAVPLTFRPGTGAVQPPCWWAMQGTGDGWKALEGGKMLCP